EMTAQAWGMASIWHSSFRDDPSGVLQPGYIKGYVPGIRENGGQYTHAATWVVWATALQGDGEIALKLWNLINPIYHGATKHQVERYKV
ncbi:GH36-type glycosyl hydrolase domain-containing protein, partial [Rhizobium ruizarguesonis]